MKSIGRFIYWILHIKECPEQDLIEEYNGSKVRCRKCNRQMFLFRS